MKKENFLKLASHLTKKEQLILFNVLAQQTSWGSDKINHIMILLQIQYGFDHQQSCDAVALFLD